MSSGTDSGGKYYGPGDFEELKRDIARSNKESLLTSLELAIHNLKDAQKVRIDSPFKDDLVRIEGSYPNS